MKTPLSIALQIMIAVIVTVEIVLGISSLIELNILQNREKQQLQQGGNVTADRISNSLAYPLWNLNQVETERVVLYELAAREVERMQEAHRTETIGLRPERIELWVVEWPIQYVGGQSDAAQAELDNDPSQLQRRIVPINQRHAAKLSQ